MILKYASTDWIGSNRIYYNEKTNDIVFDPEGFNNYLRFGYSIFGQTPLKNVKFLEANSCIYLDSNQNLVVEKGKDIALEKLGNSSTIDDTLEYMEADIKRNTKGAGENYILPLSGGYDSRIIAYFCDNKEKTQAYTYGISADESKSYEVLFAKAVAHQLGISWKRIDLTHYHKYLDKWDEYYGPSVHAHGMYHMEFYDEIKKIVPNGKVMSGIIGDIWAGSINIGSIECKSELIKLGYTHGISIADDISRLGGGGELENIFWNSNKNDLKDERYRVLTSMRLKMALLSYLYLVPQQTGYLTYTPFLNMDMAMKMLNLPMEKRKNRIWQKEFFDKVGLNFSKLNHKSDYVNIQELKALKTVPLKPLDENLLNEVVKMDYVKNVNNQVLKNVVLTIPNSGSKAISGLNTVIMKKNKKIRDAYYSYLILKPIENVLKKRK